MRLIMPRTTVRYGKAVAVIAAGGTCVGLSATGPANADPSPAAASASTTGPTRSSVSAVTPTKTPTPAAAPSKTPTPPSAPSKADAKKAMSKLSDVRVTGPIPTTTTSHPFGGAAYTRQPEDLKKIGYVEDEYFISGLANVYTWSKEGPGVVRTPNAPYTTRILVRHPAKTKKASGSVVVEPLNPSNLFDLNLGWGLMHDQLVKSGDTWVGITVKPVAMQTLKTFDPQRYQSLSMDNPLSQSDPNNCATVPSDSSRTTENGLAWDMMSQVAQLLRSNGAKNPLHYGGGAPKHGLKVYGFGYSQTGGYMYDYINAVQPLVVAATGKSLFDGYIVSQAGGAFAGAYPLNQCDPVPPVDDPRRQLTNVGVPVIHTMSQSDYLTGITARRPDSDAPTDRYRQYEMAGAGHATPNELDFAASAADIVKGGRAVPPNDCNEGPRSRFPSTIFFDAIIKNMDAWVRQGVKPPHGDPIVVKNNAPVTDRWGNVLGGLRSPYLDVPTSTWYGNSTGASFCVIAGHEVPFSKGVLNYLYPTHGAYVNKVIADTKQLVSQRFITAEDGQKLIKEARQADIP